MFLLAFGGDFWKLGFWLEKKTRVKLVLFVCLFVAGVFVGQKLVVFSHSANGP